MLAGRGHLHRRLPNRGRPSPVVAERAEAAPVARRVARLDSAGVVDALAARVLEAAEPAALERQPPPAAQLDVVRALQAQPGGALRLDPLRRVAAAQDAPRRLRVPVRRLVPAALLLGLEEGAPPARERRQRVRQHRGQRAAGLAPGQRGLAPAARGHVAAAQRAVRHLRGLVELPAQRLALAEVAAPVAPRRRLAVHSPGCLVLRLALGVPARVVGAGLGDWDTPQNRSKKSTPGARELGAFLGAPLSKGLPKGYPWPSIRKVSPTTARPAHTPLDGFKRFGPGQASPSDLTTRVPNRPRPPCNGRTTPTRR